MIEDKYSTIEAFFVKYPEVAIAFSGGVDSAYLLYEALRYAKRVKAYYVKSAFQPAFELDDARKLAGELSADMEVIDVDILACDDVTDNPSDRCYYCKKHIFDAILHHAEKDNFTVILDGTNASDDQNDRPGMKALEQMHVISPLRLCGITKDEIRLRSKEAGLFTWDKPAYACLATRIPTGRKIDADMLRRTEESEAFMFSLGFKDFRVRTYGDCARIQIREEDMTRMSEHREEIIDRLGKDYAGVLLDLSFR